MGQIRQTWAATLVAATAVFVACSTAPSPTPPSLPVTAAVGPSPTPKPTSMPVAVPHVQPPAPPPSPPPARAWTAGGITLDLPAGWSDPPNGEWIAIIFALDELGDPPAGLYTMLKNGSGLRTADHFVFRDAVGGAPTAALEARWIEADGRSFNEIVRQTAASVRADGIEVSRSRVSLRAGDTTVLAWTQPVRLGSIKIRAYFFQLPGGVARLDVGTLEISTPEIRRELRRILSSVRAAAG